MSIYFSGIQRAYVHHAQHEARRDCSHTSLCCSRLSNAQCSRKKVEFRPHIPCACLSPYFVDGYVDSTFFIFSSESLSASCLRSWDEGHGEGGWACAVRHGGYWYSCWRRTGTLRSTRPDTISCFCLLSSFSPSFLSVSISHSACRSVCWFRATCVSSSTLHFPGQCWARILHESSNAIFPSVFAQDQSCSYSMSLQIKIQWTLWSMSKIGLSQSFLAVHWNSPDSPDFPVFRYFPGVAECGVDPALSELSAHQVARPGHLRSQAHRSIFSKACDHGFQFSSMSAFPIIQTHKSPTRSLQSSLWPSSGSWMFHLFAP